MTASTSTILEDEDELWKLVQATSKSETVRKTCYDVLKQAGYQSADDFEGLSDESLMAIGLKPAHAHKMNIEAKKQRPSLICLRH